MRWAVWGPEREWDGRSGALRENGMGACLGALCACLRALCACLRALCSCLRAQANLCNFRTPQPDPSPTPARSQPTIPDLGVISLLLHFFIVQQFWNCPANLLFVRQFWTVFCVFVRQHNKTGLFVICPANNKELSLCFVRQLTKK